MPVVDQLKIDLAAYRVKVDERMEQTPGFKFNDWEMRGVPLRLEIGPKDVDEKHVMAARRDVPGRDGKVVLPLENCGAAVGKLLETIQAALLARATAFRDANIHSPLTYEELKQVVESAWAFSYWCGNPACEEKIKEDTKATVRCIPFDQPQDHGTCIVCGADATEKAYIAKAY